MATQSNMLEQLLLQPGGNVEQCCAQLLEFVRRELGFQQAPLDSPATLRFAQRFFPPMLQKLFALDPRSSPNTVCWMFSSTRWYDGLENLWQTRQQALSSYRPAPRTSSRGMQVPSNVNAGGGGGSGGGAGSAMSPSPQQRGFGADGRLVDARAIAAVEPGSVGPTLRARVSGMTREGAAIVRLLTPLADGSGPTVFDVVWRRHAVQYSYALALLPAPRRDAAEGLPGARFLVLRNEALYSRCLATPLAQQLRLHAEERRAWEMRLAYEYGNVAAAATAAAAAAGGQAAVAPPPLQLTLRMCEYFCFAFARYAAATPIDLRPNGQRAAGGGGNGGGRPAAAGSGAGGGGGSGYGSGGGGYGYGGDEVGLRGLRMLKAWLRFGVLGLVSGSPYNALVLDYARCFFPHAASPPSTAPPAAASATRGRTVGGGTVGTPGWEYTANGSVATDGGAEWGIEAEFFLRTVAEFWLNHNELLLATATLADLQAAASGGGAAAGSGGRGASPPRLPWQAAANAASGYGQLTAGYSGYPSPPRDPATVVVVGEYAPPPELALQALLTLCAHLLADPALARRSAGGVAEAAALAAAAGSGGGGSTADRGWRAGGGRASPLAARQPAAAAAAYGSAGSAGAVAAAVTPETVAASAMTPALAALQPMVFDFLRAAFCHAPPDGQPALLLAAELWLLWLQPWAAGGGGRGGGSSGGGSGGGVGGSGGGMSSPRAGANVFANLANVLHHGGGSGGGADGGAGSRRGYSDDWRAWVLANRDFYTALLAAFVRKAIELPFVAPGDRRGGVGAGGGGGSGGGGGGGSGGHGGSGGSGGGGAGLDLLARVLSVYTGPLLDVLHGGVAVGAALEAQEAAAAVLAHSPPGEEWQAANAAAASSGDLASLPAGFGGGEVALLRATREVMRPSLGGATCILERYASDAQRLGEEVAMQLARVDAAARAGGGLGTVMAGMKRGGDAHAKELRVLAGLRGVFSLPADWQPRAHLDARRGGGSPGAGSGTGGGRSRWGRSTMPERSPLCPAFLTAAGRRQLVEGQRRCMPGDAVPLPGDPLARPPLPSEIKLVCRALVWLSRRLNDAQERARVGGEEQWRVLAAERDAAAAAVAEEYALRAPDERPSAVLIRARQWTAARCLGPGPWVSVNLRPLADKGNFGWAAAAALLLQLRLMRWVEGIAALAWGLWLLVLQPAWRWLGPPPRPLPEQY